MKLNKIIKNISILFIFLYPFSLNASSNEEEKYSLNSYCNTIETPDGGSHENALKNGLLKSIKMYGKKNQFSKIYC